MPGCGMGYLQSCTRRNGTGPSSVSLSMSGANSGFVIPHLIEGDNLAGMDGQTAVDHVLRSDAITYLCFGSAGAICAGTRESTGDRNVSLHGEGHDANFGRSL